MDAYKTYHNITDANILDSDIRKMAMLEYEKLSTCMSLSYHAYDKGNYNSLENHLLEFITFSDNNYSQLVGDDSCCDIYDELKTYCDYILQNLTLTDHEYVTNYKNVWEIDNALVSNIQGIIKNFAMIEKYELAKLSYISDAIEEQLENDLMDYCEATELLDDAVKNFHISAENIFSKVDSAIENHLKESKKSSDTKDSFNDTVENFNIIENDVCNIMTISNYQINNFLFVFSQKKFK